MVEFGKILKTIGEYGLFQKLLTLALTLPNVLMPIYFCSFLFVEPDPERHCDTDWILAAEPGLSREEQLNLTVPRREDGTFSRCLMFVPVDWNISAIRERGLNRTTGCRDGWVYSSALYRATIVTDFDLVCGQSHMVEVAQTVFLTGLIFGSLVFGPTGESCGRRRSTQLPVLLAAIFGVVAGLSPNLYFYLVSQFIIAATLGGYRINSIVLATEWIGVSQRSLAACLSQEFAALGQCVTAGLIYAIRDWRTAQYVLAGSQGFVLLYIWWIPESARWLLGQGKIEEAKRVIQRAAAINGKKVPENLLRDEYQVSAEQQVQKKGLTAIFKSKVLTKHLLLISFVWFSITLGYFYLALNVGKFGLSIFLVQFLFGISEVPAHLLCIWALEAVGRKRSLMATLLVGGLVCLVSLAFGRDHAVVVTVLVTTGKFLFSWSTSVCLVYVQELFPTSARQTAVSLSSLAFRLASLLAPAFGTLAAYHWSVPIAAISGLVVVSGALVFLLPETTRKELPDFTDEAEGNVTTKTTGVNHTRIRSTKL